MTSFSQQRFAKQAFFLMLAIALVHIVAFTDLRWWLNVTGVGSDAERIEETYGYIGLVILNGGAALAFIILALVYKYGNSILKLAISAIYILRGVLGIMLIPFVNTSTTKSLELVFSLISLIIGSVAAYPGGAD